MAQRAAYGAREGFLCPSRAKTRTAVPVSTILIPPIPALLRVYAEPMPNVPLQVPTMREEVATVRPEILVAQRPHYVRNPRKVTAKCPKRRRDPAERTRPRRTCAHSGTEWRSKLSH